ncbi:MAG: methyltransferase domain-containing protein [Terriglobia bacterium]
MKTILPSPTRQWLSKQQLPIERARRRFWGGDLGSLRRMAPANAYDYGESRGQCIDRYYIESFLALHSGDVKGHVLDFADESCTRKFGGAKVTRVDVLHHTAESPKATIVADLACGDQIPSGTFDCILCTQVLHCIYDCAAAVRTLHRILKPGGVVLVTGPGIQKIDSIDMENGEEFWRFTSLSLRRLFEEVFPKNQVEVNTYGNVFAAVAFLHGFAVEDLRREDLECHDPDYEVSISLRAVK